MLPSGPIINNNNNNRPHRRPVGFTTLSPHAATFVPSSASWQQLPAAAPPPPSFSLPSPTTSSNAAISHYSRPDWNSYRQPASSSVDSASPSSPAVSCSTLGGCSNSSLTGEIYQPSRHQPDTSPHQKCSCKLLVTHKQAGAIIGKSGSEISQIEQAAKVSIKVSPSGCFFPGTQERVLVIFGESMNIREALQDIASKFEYCNEILQVQEETKSPYFRDWDESCTGVGCRARPLVMRLVVPNSAVGVLMGQHGSEIK
ncbi:RNA-binding protein Nova-1 [Perkinsus olseni]|uniref:RNA-binding protein Nova-1 n=1 Tax=Perkinsus olseni TaxID=32597 RepID=A0A7J6PZ82_PEROL|nr:RNA-binding protein Nova-1 [Perkinsus olseni]